MENWLQLVEGSHLGEDCAVKVLGLHHRTLRYSDDFEDTCITGFAEAFFGREMLDDEGCTDVGVRGN